ncbi:UNVERIFIED_ORG: hypothetical protein ABIB63_004267 [Xanthomonas axonopodis]
MRGAGQHVQISGTPVDVLTVLHAAQRGEQIAQTRGALEFQCLAGLLHRVHDLFAELIALAFEKHGGAAYRFGVIRSGHQIHAWAAATPDLVLQARPRTVAEHAVLATAQLEQLVHQAQRFAYTGDAGVRAEVTPLHRTWTAVQGNTGPLFAGQQHVWVALVVAQRHVVARRQRFDQLIFQQ